MTLKTETIPPVIKEDREIVPASITLYDDQKQKILSIGYKISPFIQAALDVVLDSWTEESLRDKMKKSIEIASQATQEKKNKTRAKNNEAKTLEGKEGD